MYCYVIVSNVSIVNISWYSTKQKKTKKSENRHKKKKSGAVHSG